MMFEIINEDLLADGVSLDEIIRHLHNCRDSCSCDYCDDYYFLDEDEYNMRCVDPSGNNCRAIPYINADWVNYNIRDVIFNNPATIVFGEDGTKTVTNCQEGDGYNKEFGLMACIIKYLTGNNGRWNEIFKDWIKEE